VSTILVVDDEQVLVDVLCAHLLKAGHVVIGAKDGLEALEICHRQGDRIDLVITGIRMPRMGGIELGNQLEALYPHLKVIYMSGYAPSRKELKAGSVFLEKPIPAEVLLSAVNAALHQAKEA